MTEKQILFDSPEAAVYRTDIEGWVDSTGRYFGNDERIARYSGCTHRKCERCNELTDKSRTVCTKCWNEMQVEKYHKMPTKMWDGKAMLYSQSADRYFNDLEEAENWLGDEQEILDDLRLIVCEPRYATQIDVENFYCDDMPEDTTIYDTHPELVKAFDELNKVIKNYKQPLCWCVGLYRAIFEEENLDDAKR